MAFLRNNLIRFRPPRWGLWFSLAFFWLGFGLGNPLGLPAQTPASTEYQLKAVFLFNFAQFVEWPTNEFADANAPLVIGILGEDPFGNYLDSLVRGERVNRRPLVIERYARVEDIKSCQILFISPSERDRYEFNFAHLSGRSILTVGDTEGFSSRGGMIRFVTEKNKIRLRINLEAAKAARLVLSSKLLRPAEIVPPRKY